MKEFTSKENTNLKTFTDNFFPQAAFYFSRLLKNKDIKVNGKRTSTNVPIKLGDNIVYYTTAQMEEKKLYDVVFEDENILICDKDSNVNSEGLFYCLQEKYGEANIFFIHRLDRNTQGLIVFAKNKNAETELSNAFKKANIKKQYLAFCTGIFDKPNEKLKAYLVKDAEKSLVKIYPQKVSGSEEIITEYFVQQQFEDFALVKIFLHTGKTHQIRAHMSFIGHSVLGDEKYGDCILNKKYKTKRQCLVAKQITFGTSGVLEYLNGQTFTSFFQPKVMQND